MPEFAPLLLNAHNPGPMTGTGNNTYFIADRGSAILVDAGTGDPRHRAALGQALADAGVPLDTVCVTHGHADHAAGAPAIAGDHPAARFFKRPWPGQDDQYAVRWTAIDEGASLGSGVGALTILHTPGHSPDHLALWHEPSGTVFTGDLVVLGSSVMIHTSKGGDLAQYMRSLERILALQPRQLLPAHGPRIDNPAALLNGYLAHRRMRERQVMEAVSAGHATVEAITGSIYRGLDAVLAAAAQENVRAHLAKLETDGLVRQTETGRWSR